MPGNKLCLQVYLEKNKHAQGAPSGPVTTPPKLQPQVLGPSALRNFVFGRSVPRGPPFGL